MSKIAIAIHGGAGTILKSKMTPQLEKEYFDVLETALRGAYDLLRNGSNSVEVVEHAVSLLEDSPLFNAGKGAVFSADGTHEMDASIMEGLELNAGAVAGVTGVKNPIGLARLVMEKSPHVFLVGKGAEEYGKLHGLPFEGSEYFYDEYRYKQWMRVKGTDEVYLDHTEVEDEKFGTVGAVALDNKGNLAAATSTGGMTNKRFGRVGDSPVIGSGTYANNKTCAISCTGSGEYFIRGVAAYDVSCLMEYKNMSLEAAANELIHRKMIDLKGDGGLIGVDAQGNIAMPFNSEGMYRACVDGEGRSEIAIYR